MMSSVLQRCQLILLITREGRAVGCVAQAAAFDVRVYLRRIEVLMPEKFLKRPDVYAAFQHKRRGGVAELVRRIFRTV